jgi:hypothetical protein
MSNKNSIREAHVLSPLYLSIDFIDLQRTYPHSIALDIPDIIIYFDTDNILVI